MTELTWEERMAQRASDRIRLEEDLCIIEARREWVQQNEAWIQDYADSLTPESAAEEDARVRANPVGCACVGGPVCCRVRYEARKRVLGK